MRRLCAAILLLSVASGLSGCAQFMAFDQPGPLGCRSDVLLTGVEQSSVIGCLGRPMATDKRTDDQNNEVMNEIYVYEDGRGKNAGWSKAGRVVIYTAGDVFTLFLTQLLWMPAEKLMLKSSKYQASVDYQRGHDGKWRITQATEAEVRN